MQEIFVTKPFLPPMAEFVAELEDIWASGILTNMGKKHAAFKQALADYLQLPQLELFANGHLAIEAAIQALDLMGEIITTPFTFPSTITAIVRSGCTPVLADIDPTTYTLDPVKVADLITSSTVAILPVHVYGHMAAVEAFEELAERHDLKLIYDACHSFGVRYKGRSALSWGDVACCSFHATKLFHTVEGGLAVYQKREVGEKLRQLKNFGIVDEDTVDLAGGNAKLNELAAAMGLCNLRHLGEILTKRKAIFELYLDKLAKVNGIVLPPTVADTVPNYAYFPILVTQDYPLTRTELLDVLRANQIYPRRYFAPLATEYKFMQGAKRGDLTVAKKIAAQVLVLPLYPELALDDVE